MVRSRIRRVGKDAVLEGSFLPYDSASGTKRPSLRLQSLISRLKGVSPFFLLQDLRASQSIPKIIVFWCPTVRRKTVDQNLWLIGCELILTAGVTDSSGMCAEQDLDWTEYTAGGVSKGASLLRSDLQDGHPGSRLTVLRPKGTRDCPPSFIRKMLTLVSAIHRELKQKRPLVKLRMQEQAAADLLEKLPIGIILLDAKRDVVLQNKSAQNILGSAESTKRNALPLDIMRSALDDGLLTKHPSGGCLCLFQPTVPQRSCAFIYPMASGSHIGESKPTIAILLTNPSRGVLSSSAVLTQLYGLTRAEVRLTSKLLLHHRITESARLLGISVNTARNQLKSIFEKTATHRQADLINLLLPIIPEYAFSLKDKNKTEG